MDLTFMTDMLLTFFTAVQTIDGELEVELYDIAIIYLSGFFIVDLLSSFPITLFLYLAQTDSSGGSALQLLRLIRLVRLLRLLRLLKVRKCCFAAIWMGYLTLVVDVGAQYDPTASYQRVG